MEQALRESEQRFQQVGENGRVFVWEADSRGRYTYVSPNVEKLLSYKPDEIVGRFCCDLFHPDVHEELKAVILKTMAQKEPFQGFLNENVSKDGRTVVLETSGIPLLDRAGNLMGYRGAARDVTDRVRAEKALRESKEMIQRHLEEIEAIYVGAPVGLCAVDRELRYLRINERLAEMNGLRAAEHIGRTIREVLPEVADQTEHLFRHVLETGEQLVDLEVSGKAALGAGGHRTYMVSYYPLRDAKSCVVGVNAMVQEITERKQAEAALAESESRFRDVADTAPVIIFQNDAEGKAKFFNKQAAEFTGRTLDSLLGEGWLDLLHPDDRDRMMASHRSSLETPMIGQRELRLRRADGQYRSMLVTASPRFLGAQFAGYIGTIVDVTCVKREQEQLLASQKLESLGVLAGGVAHHFNNLLGSILADVDLASAEIADNSPVRDGIERIRGVAARAVKVVRELMDYAGQDTIDVEPVDLTSLVTEMMPLLGVSISKKAKLETDLAGNLPALRANAAQMRRVVLNLVTNASEAIGKRDGVIRVTTRRAYIGPGSPGPDGTNLPTGDYVRLTVIDSGCGMDDETRARIFDPFFTTRFPGRGLGLAAVQGIVRDHAGALHVRSAPASGTVFEVLLPVAAESEKRAGTLQQAAEFHKGPISGASVLLVEDEESLRLPVAKMLRRSGFSVIEAGDGDTALELFRAGQPELSVVLLDLTLPGLAGAELLAALRRIRSDARVILTTAYSTEIATAAMGPEQAWRFIRKPYRLRDLIELLRAALES